MAQPFNTRQPRDENFITVPMGLLTNAPYGGVGSDACLTLTNFEPNHYGQLESRKGTDVIADFDMPEGGTEETSVEVFEHPLDNEYHYLLVRAGTHLRTYLYNPATRTATPTSFWEGVWPVSSNHLRAASARLGDITMLAVSGMVPIVVRTSQYTFVPEATSYSFSDTEEVWRYQETYLVTPDGEVAEVPVTWATGTASLEIPSSSVGGRCWLFGTTVHWACSGRRYYGNQLTRNVLRFNNVSEDRTVRLPTSLLTSRSIVSTTGYYPYTLTGPEPFQYYTYSNSDADTLGSATKYQWIGDAYHFAGNGTTSMGVSAEAVTFGAIESPEKKTSDIHFYRLVEVNAAVPDIKVMAQMSEDSPWVEFACADTVLGTATPAANTYVPHNGPNTYALGNKVSTVYKYLAFNGLPHRQLPKEAVVDVLVRNQEVELGPLWSMEYHPHKDGTLFPAPGFSSYSGSSVGPSIVTVYAGRLALGGFGATPGAVVISAKPYNPYKVQSLNFYAEETGLEVLATGPTVLEVNSEQGLRVTAAIQYLQNLLVFSDRGCWRVHGGQGRVATPDTLVVERLYNVGAYNPKSVCYGDRGLYFYGTSGLYATTYVQESYRVDRVGDEIRAELKLGEHSRNACCMYNFNASRLLVSPSGAEKFCYDIQTTMWQRIEFARRSAQTYGACLIEDSFILPATTSFGTCMVLAENSPTGHYLDYCTHTLTIEPVSTLHTNLPALVGVSSGKVSQRQSPFYITPYSLADVYSPDGIVDKLRDPAHLLIVGEYRKQGENDTAPIGVFVDDVLQVQNTDYSVTIADGKYNLAFATPVPEGAKLTVGYTYPQVLETAPLVRNTLMRGKRTRLATVVAGPARNSIVKDSFYLSATCRASPAITTEKKVAVVFGSDAPVAVLSASLYVSGVLPTIFIYNDFSPSGILIDSYHLFAETDERRKGEL